MGKQRPKWPDNYYPFLRKQVNFGCAVCGKPIPLTIHHIEGYKEGIIENHKKLIMLCDIHHREADNHDILKSKLYELKKNPCNSKTVNHGFKISNPERLAFHIGSNTFIDTPIPLRIYNQPNISVGFEHGFVLFSAKFYDKDDDLKLKIVDNVWESDTDVADIRYSEDLNGKDSHLGIKMHNSESYLNFIIKNGEAYINGKFFAKGKLFDINDKGVFLLDKQQIMMSGNLFQRCHVGIDIRKDGVGLGCS